MLLFSLLLFAAAVLILAVAVTRGLSNLDDILMIVEPNDTDTPQPSIPAEA